MSMFLPNKHKTLIWWPKLNRLCGPVAWTGCVDPPYLVQPHFRPMEHIIRAVGAILGRNEILLAGSQAYWASCTRVPPPDLLSSMAADILFVSDEADDADRLIDGSIGEGSPFHDTFGFYAHGVNDILVKLPDGWRQRLVSFSSINTNGVVAKCLDPYDLLVVKLIAGREKDLDFFRSLAAEENLNYTLLIERVKITHVSAEGKKRVIDALKRIADSPEPRHA